MMHDIVFSFPVEVDSLDFHTNFNEFSDPGVSRQASYLLTEELHSDRTGDVYTPTPQDMELVMSDYGATAKPEVCTTGLLLNQRFVLRGYC